MFWLERKTEASWNTQWYLKSRARVRLPVKTTQSEKRWAPRRTLRNANISRLGTRGWPYWKHWVLRANQGGRDGMSLSRERGACLDRALDCDPRGPHWRSHWPGPLCLPGNSGTSNVCLVCFLPSFLTISTWWGKNSKQSSHSSPTLASSVFSSPWLVSDSEKTYSREICFVLPRQVGRIN